MAVSLPPGYLNQTTRRCELRTLQVAVGTVPQLVVPYNNNRLSTALTNIGASTVFLSRRQTCNVNDGYPLVAGSSMVLNGNEEVYGIVAAGSVTLGIAEETIRAA